MPRKVIRRKKNIPCQHCGKLFDDPLALLCDACTRREDLDASENHSRGCNSTECSPEL